uniref:Uncharacterized protein n=1 Tax=Anguilla anguilla TaxID=7936 RepID=A0A0E9WYH0_ANGAN
MIWNARVVQTACWILWTFVTSSSCCKVCLVIVLWVLLSFSCFFFVCFFCYSFVPLVLCYVFVISSHIFAFSAKQA